MSALSINQITRAAQAHQAAIRREWVKLHPDRPDSCPVTPWDEIPPASRAVLVAAMRVALTAALQTERPV